MFLNSFFYYILFCSSVLIYGIGFNRESVMCNNPRKVLFNAVKSYACVILSFIIMFFLNKALLIPLDIVEVFPFFALIVYIAMTVFLEVIIQITTKKTSAEFAVSFLVLLLSVNEASTWLEGIFICAGCLFYVLIPILYALDKRMETSSANNMFKQKSLIFLSMVIIMIALYSFNISWLNSGVIK